MSPPEAAAFLIIGAGPSERRVPLVGRTTWTVGRNADNDIVLDGNWISRNHAMLQLLETGKFFLIDLGSRNGSFVNGRRVTAPATLHDNDRVALGQAEFTFRCPSEVPEPEPTPFIDLEQSGMERTTALRARKLISVLVVDIRDFTMLTRAISEEQLSELVGAWFNRAGSVVEQHGGFVDKYIGDALMAVWFHSDSAIEREDVARMYLAMNALREAAERLNERFPLPMPIRVGIGVNTGHAIVANTGTATRPDYTALGDTVNAAFRLESCNKEMGTEITLGKGTHDLLKSFSACPSPFRPHKAKLKGYEEQILVYTGTFDDLRQYLDEAETQRRGAARS